MKARDLGQVPVIVGGIIPQEDADRLLASGVRAVYTPKDFDMNAIMCDMVNVIRRQYGLEPQGELVPAG